MNGIMVDIVAVVLIVIFVIVGIKRGFAKEVIDFVMGIVLIPICLILMIPISGIIVSTTKIVANIAGKNITDGIIKGISFIAAYVLLTIIVIIFRTTILGIIENIRNNKRNKQYFRRGIWSNKSNFNNIYSINNCTNC